MSTPLFLDQRTALKSYFVEREEVIDAMFVAHIARQSVFLLGPPGTSKSALARAVAMALGLSYFEWMLGKFTTPEDLYGPISLEGYKTDRHVRITTGRLPEAETVFLDELWKCSAAIAYTLLTAVNERLFHNGPTPTPIPLVTLIGASNELPEADSELEAMWDRLVLRFQVGSVVDSAGWRRITFGGNPPNVTAVGRRALAEAQAAAAALVFDAAMESTLDTIRLEALKLGIDASNRRWKAIATVVRGTAALDGASGVTPRSFRYVPACLWRTPEEAPKATKAVLDIINPALHAAKRFLDEARQKAAALKAFTGTRAELVSQAAASTGEIEDMRKELSRLIAAATEDQAQDLEPYVDGLTRCAEEVSRTGIEAYRTRNGGG